jgi:biopolymer transport protein ExbB
MVPLMFCSVLSLAVMIERYLTLKRATGDTGQLARSVEDHLYSGEPDKAEKLCESHSGPVAGILHAGIRQRRCGVQHVQRAIEEQALKEQATLQIRLGVLDTIITIAPLLGLLGTVTGMIGSFHVISSKQGLSAPTAITGGVAEALIATATGLTIAIATLIGYNYFNERVKRAIEMMELRATQIINVLSDIEERRNEIKSLSA